MSATIWTIGHSTRSIEEFLVVLAAHGIEALADVRRFPGSRRLPWFGAERLVPPARIVRGALTWSAPPGAGPAAARGA
jgi:uncharacterized protein (DUF488 family)